MATKQATNNISVRKKRNYSMSFPWTPELNEDAYNLYLIARQNPHKGYMNRHKALWDEKHPEHTQVTKEQLRERAVFVEKKKKALTNDTINDTNNVETVEAATTPAPPTHPPETTASSSTEPDTNHNNDTDNSELTERMRVAFETNLNEVINLQLSERKYATKVNKKVEDIHISTINRIVSDYISTSSETLSFWDINCIQYSAAITVLSEVSELKEIKHNTNKPKKQKWLAEAENQINCIRRKLSYVTLVMNCNDNDILSKKQQTIKNKVKKMCKNLRKESLESTAASLKHQLKVCNTKLKDKKTKAERSRINTQFQDNQKQVFRNWKGSKVEVNNPPTVEGVKTFWSDIWGKETPVNLESDWHAELKETYCINVNGKDYTITKEVLLKVLAKTPNNKAPGNDKLVAYWLKYLPALHPHLLNQLIQVKEEKIELPQWLVTSKTIILPKNNETHLPKNYRPIACLNSTYKLFTSILNTFLDDHCNENDVILQEQAGGKKGSWGCTDQLLINKMVFDEVREKRRNLFTMYFDYKKAFDSIPHKWLIEALQLAKVHPNIIAVIKSLTEKWATQVHLQTGETVTVTDVIKYLTGAFQGDSLVLKLFTICVNPLSHLLNKKCEGYSAGPTNNRTLKLTHLLFVDDLKTFAPNKEVAIKQLEVITEFSQDIGMKFGVDKCAYIYIERGKRKTIGECIEINGLPLNELKDHDTYKYLGLDEDIAYKGELNKDRVRKEYFNRVNKIWKSELYSKNKIIAHNIFANTVFTLTFSILNWTKEEILQIDIKTRKLLTRTGNFHRNSSVDRLYANRTDGGRGLNSIYDNYVTRMIAVTKHLRTAAETNSYLHAVIQHEQDRLLRVADEFAQALKIPTDNENVSQLTKTSLKQNHLLAYQSKDQHGYIHQKQAAIEGYNKKMTNNWINSRGLTSHNEGYIFAITEQEINTRALQSKREHAKNQEFDSKCRYCHSKNEDIFHLLCSCDSLSASMYLPFRHDEVAKELYNAVIKHHFPAQSYTLPTSIWVHQHIEIWWDTHVHTVPPVKNNKPDIVIWNKTRKTCHITDICVPLDQNVHKQEKMKIDTYTPLCVNLRRLYPDYSYEVVPIVLGATGLITDSLMNHLATLLENPKEVHSTTATMQRKAMIGSMRVLKSALAKKD